MITFSHVSKYFDNSAHVAVQDLSFDMQKGETLVILGSSGAGKSTILKLINRLLIPDQGQIEIDGIDIQTQNPVALRRTIGYVFQGIGLFPHLTVSENISIVLRLLKKSTTFQHQRAKELLELVGLSPDIFSQRYPSELSGGEQQRVGVARALAADPHYLLMDEPFGALDTLTRHDLQQEILHIKKTLHKTILFVTHDILEALCLGDRLAVMHEGKLEQIGTKHALIHAPATDFVRELFNKAAQQIQNFSTYFT